MLEGRRRLDNVVAEWTGSERAGLDEQLIVVEVAGRRRLDNHNHLLLSELERRLASGCC